jgi:hypothetical protein
MRVLVLCAVAAAGCDRILPERLDFELPPIEDVATVYRTHGVDADISYNGNVVELRVVQPLRQLERGGSLWARAGAFIYLFSPATRDVFDEWDGIAAVRAITRTEDDVEIARAMLARDRFGARAWQRTHHLLGIALRDGSERPIEMQRLAEWGERHTEFRYNERFAPGWSERSR